MRRRYTDEERALIAGYLLRMRAGTQRAKDSVDRAPPNQTGGWGEGNQRYYRNALQYSSFLLSWIGYLPNGQTAPQAPPGRGGRRAIGG